MTGFFIALAQAALIQALSLATQWGKAKLKEIWEHAKKRALELDGMQGLTGKQKAGILSEELRLAALDLSPDATDAAVETALHAAFPFLNQVIEILIPFAVIVARAQQKATT